MKNLEIQNIIRCKECIHKPKRVIFSDSEEEYIDFPDWKCPLRCEDSWYNRMSPTNDWFCGNGEK